MEDIYLALISLAKIKSSFIYSLDKFINNLNISHYGEFHADVRDCEIRLCLGLVTF